jgi:2-(1,2-epoxy-1,2-dihydrophenyl)acetyl-CoA isomerase
MESEFFVVEKADGVARCSMNGPTMNAMGMDLLPPMFEGLADALADDEVRVIVLRGEGGNFCVGADLSIMGEKMDPMFLYENMKKFADIGYILHEGPKPVITEVDGWAAGGGFSLALCSDITYATERARFYMSFVRISIIPDLGASYYLPRRVGLARAKELALAARVIDSAEAERIGLINGVFDHESISDEVMKGAKRMAKASPTVLEMTKRNLNWSHRLDLKTMLDNEASTQPFLVMSPEHQEAIKKFMEKQGGGKD